MSRPHACPARLRPAIALAALIAALVASAAWTPAASAAFGLSSFDVTYTDEFGDPQTQAGSHPYALTTTLRFNTTTDPQLGEIPDEALKDLTIAQIPGLAGDATAVPACPTVDFFTLSSGTVPECDDSSAVGLAEAGVSLPTSTFTTPVYSISPAPGAAATIGFWATSATPVTVDLIVNPDPPHNIVARLRNAPQPIPLYSSVLEIWGNPADPVHDDRRGSCFAVGGGACPAGIAVKPFITLPRSCQGPLAVQWQISSWQNPEDVLAGSHLSHDAGGEPQGFTGCEGLGFDPAVSAEPTTTRAASPSGIDFGIQIDDPGLTDPDGIAASDLKKAVVTLPDGMSVNPSSADGLEACSPAQVDAETYDSDFGAGCPAESKIGSVEIETPLLEEHLEGSIFLAEQDNNPFGTLLAGYIVAKSPERGISIALPGKIEANPLTGQVTAEFDNNPELPFSDLDVQFKTGNRAPLITPDTCGTYEITTELTPWSGNAPVTRTSEFTVDKGPDGGPCLAGDASEPGDTADLAERPFAPEMNAGLVSNTAGGFSPFVFRLTRDDGHQEILTTTVRPPEGLTAKLAGTTICPSPQAAAGNCPANSKIGEAIVGAGAGPNPFYIKPPNQGTVYLAGPYKGAPLSMLIQVPAVAGPFDLGMVDVRAQVRVDPESAALTVVSDELPQILEGIPLKVRDIRIRVDRPGFTLAPTDCDPKQLSATIGGSHGAATNLHQHFQVQGCAGLGFEPTIDFRADNKDAIVRSDHPALDTTLSIPHPPGAFTPGSGVRPNANIAKAVVTLPSSILLDQDSLETICTRAQYAAEACPANTQYGYAKATTPLLDETLEGPVYLRSSDNPLPDLVADLNGIIDVDLVGEIDQTGGALSSLRTTFSTPPDVAVSSFNLKLVGGTEGLLVNSQNVCANRDRRTVDVELYGQSNQASYQRPVIAIPECVKQAKKEAKTLKKQAKKLDKKAKKLKKKARKASGKKAKKLRKKAKRLKKRANKLRSEADRVVEESG